MDFLLIAVIVIIGIALLLALSKGKGRAQTPPYQLSKYLLSKAERSFYGVLVQAVGNSGLVFSKVRIADVITPRKGMDRSTWQRAFNAIAAKHFDFLICDPQDCSVRLAVELDDSSHSSFKGQKRDNFINSACVSAGLPLLRVKASQGYVVSDIQGQVEALLHRHAKLLDASTPHEPPVPETPTPTPAGIGHKSAVSTPEVSAQAVMSEDRDVTPPPCPKCGEPMLQRMSKSGNHAGQGFWGCSTFPRCHGTIKN